MKLFAKRPSHAFVETDVSLVKANMAYVRKNVVVNDDDDVDDDDDDDDKDDDDGDDG